MGFDAAVLKCMSKYAVFTGRARPSEFWWFMFLYLSAFVLSLAALALSTGLAKAGLAGRLSILIGIGPLASARSARWMRDNLHGTIIPDAIIERLDAVSDPKREGTMICAELLAELAEIPGISGAHLMAPLNEAAVPAAIKQSGVLALR